MDRGAWWAAVHGVTGSWARLSNFTFTFHFHALEKEMATHSSGLAWRIPGTGKPGRLPSMGSHRVGHDWSDSAAAVFAIVGFSKVSWMNIKSLICFWSEVWGSLSNHCVYMQAWKESNNNLCFTALVTECYGRLGSLVQKQHMRVMLEFWTLLESCCQDDWILHYLLWVPSPLYQKRLYNFEPLTSERLKVKINSRRHHCEIFGARAITIITGFIEGLLLVHDVAVPMFLSLELFEL